MGGPYVSLSPEAVRPYADILVHGEIEALAPQLFADLRDDNWQTDYFGGQPDVAQSPVPRWDLYPNDRALVGCVQTSRGCPFECEFCDVIQYAGRKQRHKSVEQILAELDVLYQQGYSNVFLADDNFTVYRRRTKELLLALREWNNRQPDGRLTFSTQLSIDIDREDEILQLCAEAGINYVFIGIETPNEESLKETKKRQNVGVDLVSQIERLLDYGIAIIGGMIVGFDSDGLDIFQRQYEFAMSTPIPIFTLGALIAPAATPLYDRMQRENRLLGQTDNLNGATANPWMTNIIPQQMSQEELLSGMRWLGNQLYHPSAFGKRIFQFIERCQPLPEQQLRTSRRRVEVEMLQVLQDVSRLGSEEGQMFLEVIKASMQKPDLQRLIMHMLFQYRQIRYMYDHGQFWEPHLAQQPEPIFQQPIYLKGEQNVLPLTSA
ncbi:MAG: radical SAM protein [Chloroflexota bacterium]